MKKFIKLNNERIIDIRSLKELDLFKDEELLKNFKKEFIEVDAPDGYNDIELMVRFIYKNNQFIETTQFIDAEKIKNEIYEIED